MKYRIIDTQLAPKISNSLKIPMLASKVLASKNKMVIKDFLDYKYEFPKFEMLDDAIKTINQVMDKKQKIMIMGDYDCDGILATSILVKTFELLEYSNVDYYIPNRINDGYGINPNLVEKFKNEDVDLIITVDNGINAIEPIEKALALNMQIIITDHHNPDESYVNGVTYIHPVFSNIDYAISGGVVAYYLACALLTYEDDYLQSLATITTISDVMPLIKGNRKFVRKGLNNINNKNFLAIKLLATGFIDSAMIGSVIAPKINALGRLPDLLNPNSLVKYFISTDQQALTRYAKEIDKVNNKRKELSNEFYEKHKDDSFNEKFMLIKDDDMHEGLIGLLASRFANEYNCICFVSTNNEDDEYKASLRSVEGVDVLDIVRKNEKLFKRYGGHAQAMGLTFEGSKINEIKQMFEDNLDQIDFAEKNYDVIKVEASELDLNNVKSLRYLEPYGNGFEAPNFLLTDGIVTKIKALKGGIHHKVNLLYKDANIEVMFFFSENLALKVNDVIDVIISAGINVFNNKESCNYIVQAYSIQK